MRIRSLPLNPVWPTRESVCLSQRAVTSIRLGSVEKHPLIVCYYYYKILIINAHADQSHSLTDTLQKQLLVAHAS